MAKKAKKPAAKAAKKKTKAKVKLSAAAKESVVNIKASEHLAGIFLEKKEKLAEMETKIARMTGERKDAMSQRAELARELEEDAMELARVASGGHFEQLFTEAGIVKEKAKLEQPTSAEGQTVAAVAQASPAKPTLAQREKELSAVPMSEFASGALLERFEGAGIRNGLELFRWLNDRFAAPIKGVGEAAKVKAGDKLTDWWMNHPYEEGKSASTLPPKQSDGPLTISKPESPEDTADQVRDSDAVDVINIKGKLVLQVAPRRNENLCYGFLLQLDKDHKFEQQWFGHYDDSSRDKLYADALDAVTKKLHEWEAGTLPINSIETAKQIHAAIIEAGKLQHKKARKAAVESGETAATFA